MLICEWKEFSTDAELFTRDVFEETVGDEFEAMMYKGDNPIPSYIWTVN